MLCSGLQDLCSVIRFKLLLFPRSQLAPFVSKVKIPQQLNGFRMFEKIGSVDTIYMLSGYSPLFNGFLLLRAELHCPHYDDNERFPHLNHF